MQNIVFLILQKKKLQNYACSRLFTRMRKLGENGKNSPVSNLFLKKRRKKGNGRSSPVCLILKKIK